MQRFKNILCVVNDVKSSKEALQRAVRLAQNNQARLTVTGLAPHVSVGMGMPENGQISRELQAAVVKTCASELAAAVSELDNHRQIETRVLVGIGFLEIIRDVLRHDFDLVIKVTEKTEWLQWMFGSEDMHLLRKCPCPDAAGRAAMNKAAYDALKTGGIYAVVDHTRRHMEADSPENRRRLDPVLAIKEIQQAGFELVDFSDLHFRPDDELRYEVGRKTVTGNTDRWTLKFVKK